MEQTDVTGLYVLNPEDLHTLGQIRKFITGGQYTALMDLVRCALVPSGTPSPQEIQDAREIAFYLLEDLECLGKIASAGAEVEMVSLPNCGPAENPSGTVLELLMLELVLHRHEVEVGPGDVEPLNAISDLICYWRARDEAEQEADDDD